LNRQSKESNS